MYHLATVAPQTQRWRMPLSRDQVILLIAAVNEMFLGLDTYLAHFANGTIRPREWVPILFGPAAGLLLLLAGVIALRNRSLASQLATLVFIASMVVGALGAYFHLIRGSLPTAPAGSRLTLDLMVWAPPIFAPFAFALVGVMGLSAAWIESPADSGTLTLPFGWRLPLPYSKTQAYFMMTSSGVLIALVSSVLDHARDWSTPWFWLPVVAGVFATVVAAGIGFVHQPTRADLLVYIGAMLFLMLVGVIGAFFHIQADLTAQSVIIPERFLRGAPFLAPLLYTNMGMIGLAVLLDPQEK